MSKTSTALRRLGVGVLSAATLTAGLTALAPVANAATADITGLKITPASATDSTGEDTCEIYTVDVTESGGHTDGTLTVKLQPTGGVDSQFCGGDAPAPTNPNNTQGGADFADFVIGADNQVKVGVNDADGPGGNQGQIAITAFPQNTTVGGNPQQPASGAPTASATLNILTAAAQNDVVTNLSVSPTTASGTEGDTVTYTVTATNGSSSVVKGAQVYYTAKSSQGNSVGQDNVNCGATDNLGQVDCDVTVPATTSVQSGPYTITFKVPQNAAGQSAASGAIPPSNSGPTTTATLTSIAQAANGSTLILECGTGSTNRYASSYCEDSRSARSETITAFVTNPPTGGATEGTPEAGVQVHFYINYYGFGPNSPTLDPEDCVTGADGSCSVTVHRDAAETGQQYIDVRGYITTPGGTVNDSQDAYVEFGYGFESPATNIDATPASQSGNTGETKTVTFNVTNQYGVPANETCFTDEYDFAQAQGSSCDSLAGTSGNMSTDIPVHVVITGAGTFSDGTTTKTVNAQNGVVQVAVTSGAAGTSTITGSLDPSLTDCTVPAGSDTANNPNNYNDYWYEDTEAEAGNCDDSAEIDWSNGQSTGKHAIGLHLACFSHHKGKIKCVAQTGPATQGVTVKFFNKKGHKVATDVTNKAGKAHFVKTGKKSGKTYVFQAHANHTATTYSADSKRAKVTVQ